MKRVELEGHIEKVQSTLYWNYRIPIESDVANSIIGKDKRINCSINDEVRFNCALLPDGNGGFFININKSIRTQLKLESGQKLHLVLEKDESKYGMPVPPTFEELLYQDPEGEAIFNALTPGKRRSLLFIIAKPKSEQKQLEKGLIILDYLKESNGILDYKGLNEAFKSNRYR